MKHLIATVLFITTPFFATAQSQKVERMNSVRHVTAQTCEQLATVYSFLGETCRQKVVVAVKQDPGADTGFAVTIHYDGGSSESQLIPVTEPFGPDGRPTGHWPPSATFYIDNITLNSVTITGVPSGSITTISGLH